MWSMDNRLRSLCVKEATFVVDSALVTRQQQHCTWSSRLHPPTDAERLVG